MLMLLPLKFCSIKIWTFKVGFLNFTIFLLGKSIYELNMFKSFGCESGPRKVMWQNNWWIIDIFVWQNKVRKWCRKI